MIAECRSHPVDLDDSRQDGACAGCHAGRGRSTQRLEQGVDEVSLTGCLRVPTSPLRRLLDADCAAGVVVLRADYRSRMPLAVPLAVPAGVDRERGTVGMAVDHRLRLAFTAAEVDGHAARHGVAYAALLAADLETGTARSWWSALAVAGREVLVEIARLARTWQLDDRGLPFARATEQEDALARLLVVAAWYEVLFRAGPIAFDGTPIARFAPDQPSLVDLITLVPEPLVTDVVAQIMLAENNELASLRATSTSGSCAAGTVFDGSADVGGADADLLVDGLLVEFKATSDPWTLPRTTVQQLLGYLLLDYTNAWSIHSLALYTTRTGTFTCWPADQFLALLGARYDLPRLRTRMRRVCARADVGLPDADTSARTENLLRTLSVPDLGRCHRCGEVTAGPRTRHCSLRCRHHDRALALDALTNPEAPLRARRPTPD